MTIACQAPSRISHRRTSPPSHAPLRETRRELRDPISSDSDRRHHRVVAVTAEADGQALVGGRDDRRCP